MRSHGSAEELERRRLLAVKRVAEGRTLVEVARFLGVSYWSMKDWWRRYVSGGELALASKPHPPRRSKLTDDQAAAVLSWFDKSPTDPEFGFDTELWTAARVASVIRERFGVKYHPGSLLRWLKARGITSQMVRRRPRGHNPQEMVRWANEQWPQILKRAEEFAARIVMIDETGMLMRPLVRKSLARRGHPLVIRYKSNHRQKVSVQGAIVLGPDGRAEGLRTQMHEDAYVDGLATSQFLRRLLREYTGPLIVVWDRGNMHKGPHVRQVLEEFPRLSIEQLPPYCPDLNPIEPLWGWIKYGRLANFCPKTLRELTSKVANIIATAAENLSLLDRFTRAAGLAANAQIAGGLDG
jgi:transposase